MAIILIISLVFFILLIFMKIDHKNANISKKEISEKIESMI